MCLSSSCSTGTSPRSENFGAAAFSPSRSMDKTLARAKRVEDLVQQPRATCL